MGELVHLTRGVWRPPVVANDFAGRIAAIVSAMPANTVVCGWTAARLHGLWLPDEPDHDDVEVIVHPLTPLPRDRPHSIRSAVRVRRHTLAPDEVTSLDGTVITTEARTWLDLARVLGPVDLLAAGDSALRGAATPNEMAELLSRAGHRRGVVRARAVLPWLDRRSRSRPESHLRYALVSAGLPAPEVNKAIYRPGGQWLAEPDLSYDDVRLALEYNGADHAEVKRMRRDITRELDLSDADWHIEVFGPTQVFARPDQIATLVGRLRAERSRFVRPRLSGDVWG